MRTESEWSKYVKPLDTPYNISKHKIYGLIDPDTETCFYIGVTRTSMVLRFSGHLSDLHITPRSGLKKRKIDELLKSGKYPIIKIFYEIEDRKTARLVEKYLIHFLVNLEHKIELLNYSNKNFVSEDFFPNKK